MEYSKPPKIDRKKFSSVNAMLIYKNLPYICLLFVLALVYVANVHYAEKHLRTTQVLNEEIKELKWDYWTLKSGIMYNSTEGQILKKVKEKEIYVPDQAPKKLIRVEN